MVLSYRELLGDGKRRRIKATITTDHALSSYGQPVIVLDDGQPLNAESWALLGYQVVKATKAERTLLAKWLAVLSLQGGAQ